MLAVAGSLWILKRLVKFWLQPYLYIAAMRSLDEQGEMESQVLAFCSSQRPGDQSPVYCMLQGYRGWKAEKASCHTLLVCNTAVMPSLPVVVVVVIGGSTTMYCPSDLSSTYLCGGPYHGGRTRNVKHSPTHNHAHMLQCPGVVVLTIVLQIVLVLMSILYIQYMFKQPAISIDLSLQSWRKNACPVDFRNRLPGW